MNKPLERHKLVFIVNPAAKNGYCLKIWKRLEKKLSDVQYEVYFTEKEADGVELATNTANDAVSSVLIVAVGGDGTIHEVINGVIDFPHVTIGYIPAGSGNDFARGFRLPANPEKCIEFILKWIDSSGVDYDAGFYELGNGQCGYFVNSIGAGFDAVITKKANSSELKKWLNVFSLGKLIYAFYLVTEIFRYRPSTLEIFVDGKTKVYNKTWFVTISNQPYYGGGMQIAPLADPKDEKLNVVVVHELSRLKLLFLFISVFWGGHLKNKEVDSYKGKEITVRFYDSKPIHADGENIGETPIHIRVCPKSWRLIQNPDKLPPKK
ncbi:diacylglycerol/lipid kinase family protein [Lederbergia citrea]|uniref:Diacylglycerol kinase family lipid kinase n=1 Tax=Lederbergia citrea TaxID=2833581 RepID=A0A942ULB1_9BACI|nr:diacylglycerol kinase family protein [Lederbergia citrea]MBS4222800.1 diacylglycerol kinase family lipid kinase [Lederbergia citrea]